MALTVREVMDADPAFVYAGDPTERVLEVLRVHELPGVPVVNEGDRCVGIITERDLILSGENEDLHLPHYFQLFGGACSSSASATSRTGCARPPLRSPRTS